MFVRFYLWEMPLMSSSDENTRDRLIALEVEVRHLGESLSSYGEKVNAMHNLLMQAKGMKYLIMLMATIGGAVSALAVKYFPFLRG
jgi:hypothetical protein